MDMRKDLRTRFWVEVALASLTAGLLMLTLAWSEWIELLFGVAPDSGDGSVESAFVTVLVVITAGIGLLAGLEWRRAGPASATS
jgi:hypothetical protein